MQQLKVKPVRASHGEFGWVDLAAQDLDAQTRFYETLFGWTHEDIPTGQGQAYRMFYLDGERVAGASQMSPELYPPGTPSMWITYVMSDDVDQTIAKAEQLGGQVVMPAVDVDVMGDGRMAGVQEPAGTFVFFLRPGEDGGVQRASEPGSLVWNDLSTREPEKAVEFFTRLLPWEIRPITGSSTPYWQIDVAGMPEGGITPMPPQMPEHAPGSWLVYFGVENIRAFHAQATSAGCGPQMEPIDAGGTAFCVFSDPAGAVFAVMEPARM